MRKRTGEQLDRIDSGHAGQSALFPLPLGGALQTALAEFNVQLTSRN